MSVFRIAPRPAEKRGIFPYPVIPPNSAVGSRGSYDRVSLWQAEASLQKVAVWAATNLIATFASTLPVGVYTGSGSGTKPASPTLFLQDPDGTGHGMGDWLYQLTMSWLLRGNAYGLVLERDGVGRPSQVLLQHPDDVQAQRAEDGSVVWRVRGQVVDPGRMWHQRVYPIPGSILGMSPVSMHATTIGLGISAERFGEQWFADGAHPSGMLVNDSAKDITPEQATTLKQRFMAAVRGTREPVVMGQGWRYQQLQIAPNESQFLETQQMTSAECARIFGPGMPEILGYATGGNLTYANVEQRSLDLLTYALDPWLVRIEKILTEHLPAPRYVRFNRNALLRTDTLTRYQAHEIALRAKFNVVNEIRDLEDLPPVPWGDTPVPVETKTQEAQSVPQLIPAPGGTDG